MNRINILILFILFGCDDATEASAGACARSDLVAQCPLGSNPILGVQAEASCSDAVGGVVQDGQGQAAAQCFGVGSCSVMCQFAVPCRCGIASIGRDGVVCAECGEAASCGNDFCEGGESPQNCPIDCAGRCNAGERRCDGELLQECNLQGRFDVLPCPSGEVCGIVDGVARCMRDPDVIIADDAGLDDRGPPIEDGRILPGDGTWPVIEALPAAPFPLAGRAAEVPINAGELAAAMAVAGGPIWRWRLRGDGYEGLSAPGTLRLDANGRVTRRHPAEYPPATLEAFCEAFMRCWGHADPAVCAEPFARYEAEPDGFWRRDCLTALGQNCTIFTELTDDCQPTPLYPHPDGERLTPTGFAVAGDRLVGIRPDRTRLVAIDLAAGTHVSHEALGEYTFPEAEGLLAVSADGRVVAALAQRVFDQVIVVWEPGVSAPRPLLPLSVGSYNRLALSPDGQVLALTVQGASEPEIEQVVSVWNLAEEQRIFSIRPIMGENAPGQRLLAFSPTGDELVIDVAGRTMAEVWRLGPEPVKQQTLALDEVIERGAYAPDGLTLALAGESSRQVTLWSPRDGQRRQTLPATDAPVRDFDFAAGRLLITSADRRTGVILRVVGP